MVKQGKKRSLIESRKEERGNLETAKGKCNKVIRNSEEKKEENVIHTGGNKQKKAKLEKEKVKEKEKDDIACKENVDEMEEENESGHSNSEENDSNDEEENLKEENDSDSLDSDSDSQSDTDNDNDEEEEDSEEEEEQQQQQEDDGNEDDDDEEENEDEGAFNGIKSIKHPITVILDKASLETVKMKSGNFSLLNCDDHQNMMRKYKKNPQDFRPDILHQELLALIDSPLNKVGKLQIYVHTEKNVLIEINPKCRIPRTFRRFAGLMVQVLHKLKIRSADGKETLLKVVKNPVSRHFKPGSHVYAFSHLGELTSPQNLAKKLPYNEPIVLCVGAMAVGHITVNDHPYMEKMFSVSDFPLSGATALNRILGAIEMEKGIF